LGNIKESPSRREFLAAVAASGLPALAQTKTPVVDAHCHAGLGVRLLAPWSTRANLEVTLRHMAEAGIDRTVIFPIENPGYERANTEISEICQRYPEKFIGFARHDAKIEAGRIPAMLRGEVRELGLKGLKIIGAPPDRETLEVMAELGIPVLHHAGRVAVIRKLAEAHPKVPFIAAHLGSYNANWSEYLEAIKAASELPNVYLDTSCTAFWQILEMAAKEAGADKVIFGSDGPEFDSRTSLYRIKLLKLSPADEAKVLGGNILRLLSNVKAL
jgi:predicted TIM-barrel fold metal-dependent hydrolase